MIDSHAHLNFPQLCSQIDEIVADSKKAGVTGIILASSNLKDSVISIELVKKYPGYLFASTGIHPQKTDPPSPALAGFGEAGPENKTSIEEQLSALESLITSHQSLITAIGETGLDFSPAPPGEEDRSHEEQEKLFLGQINLAQKYNLPLIIHARSASAKLRRDKEAVDETIKILADFEQIRADPQPIRENQLRGVFHCYAGGKKRIQKILDLEMSLRGLSRAEAISKENRDCHVPTTIGTRNTSDPHWYFGFDGNLTYDEGLQNILKLIPQDRILIETDAPFLTPAPHRGETNTPAFLPLVQQKINEILGKDLTEQIFKNTQILFHLQR